MINAQIVCLSSSQRCTWLEAAGARAGVIEKVLKGAGLLKSRRVRPSEYSKILKCLVEAETASSKKFLKIPITFGLLYNLWVNLPPN